MSPEARRLAHIARCLHDMDPRTRGSDYWVRRQFVRGGPTIQRLPEFREGVLRAGRHGDRRGLFMHNVEEEMEVPPAIGLFRNLRPGLALTNSRALISEFNEWMPCKA